MKALLGRVEALLKELEFCLSEGDHCSVCPSCRECVHKHGDRAGHREDCELSNVLKAVRDKRAETP